MNKARSCFVVFVRKIALPEREEAVVVEFFKTAYKVFFEQKNAVCRPEGNALIIIIAFFRIFDYYRTVLGKRNLEVSFTIRELAVFKDDFIAANINMRISKIV